MKEYKVDDNKSLEIISWVLHHGLKFKPQFEGDPGLLSQPFPSLASVNLILGERGSIFEHQGNDFSREQWWVAFCFIISRPNSFHINMFINNSKLYELISRPPAKLLEQGSELEEGKALIVKKNLEATLPIELTSIILNYYRIFPPLLKKPASSITSDVPNSKDECNLSPAKQTCLIM